MLVRKPGGMIAQRRPRHRWEDNIKTDLEEIRMGQCELDSSGMG
jgi:hypothetical protein